MALGSHPSALSSVDDEFRSRYVCRLVQSQAGQRPCGRRVNAGAPKTVTQFWDAPSDLPKDVALCMDSWQSLRRDGFRVRRFDDTSARRFVSRSMAPRHLSAFDRCYHPAMRSDYFRMCYIGLLG